MGFLPTLGRPTFSQDQDYQTFQHKYCNPVQPMLPIHSYSCKDREPPPSLCVTHLLVAQSATLYSTVFPLSITNTFSQSQTSQCAEIEFCNSVNSFLVWFGLVWKGLLILIWFL